MSTEPTNPGTCQVDFYLPADSSATAEKLACRLALMAWERNQKVFVITSTPEAARQLSDLMWNYPEGRFLPHADLAEPGSENAPVKIGTLSGLNPADVVINLCPEAVPQPQRFRRILEFVPFAEDERQASRVKFRTYRNQDLNPEMHNING